MGRKRQRSRAALTDDSDEQPLPVDESTESTQDDDLDPQSQPDDDDELDSERSQAHDVWTSFKEEHHEVLEQLPLSLHRQFKLMRELDSHGDAFHVELLASVRRYVWLRESLAARQARLDATRAEAARSNGTDANAEQGDDAMQVDPVEATHGSPPNTTTTSPAFHPKPGETTRTLLQHIAQTSEEAIRTAEEKVNIAQTAYETVDRHIRFLDQAIKEQEAAISLGVRPGTHLAPILLPDLVVPRWARPPRVEHSPVPSLSPEPGLYVEEPPVLELPPPQVLAFKIPKKGKKAAPKPEEGHPPAVATSEEGLRMRRTSVRLTLPPQPGVTEPSVPADPNEKRYCYCNQVSFGTMIGCDREDCRLEWFHFECTGLSEVPSKKAKWYCRECKPKVTHKGRSKG